MEKAYNPQQFEDDIYKRWEKSGYFNPDNCLKDGITSETAPVFSMVLPPPNVTGNLHVGHSVMLAIQDTLTRYHRMIGDRTLWLPGTDHAAIATQSKVEKILFDTEQKTKYDLGREEFLKRVEKFAQDSHDTIINQSKKMGASLDWSREAYTLDAKRNLAVRTTFKRMYDDGIIYRGHRIINWDPKLQTTVSDDEMDHTEEKSNFFYLQYGPFEIATARPETKFGDKYVVMHPKDERYEQYKHGQKIDLEWINGPVTATIIKDEAIDMEFGTGVMTITPWHDATDFEIAERHNLEKEQIIDYNGQLLPIAGEFAGMDIDEARTTIVEKLKAKGLLNKIDENYIHNVTINSRGAGKIEPQIKEQWFVAVNKEFNHFGKKTTLKQLMIDAVESSSIEIIPERFKKTYFRWINNLRDWCISRQLWYGHQIPVWYKSDEIYVGIEAPAGEGWAQDPDTLDTWFSAGLWTFSTLGWPEETDDFKTYHPTTVLETGYDILFFWVARMILMSTYLLNEIPFKTVYLHGLVRDEKGQKMSKSLGNIIDPLDVIPKYGTDAVRLSLMIGSSPGNDTKLSEEKIAGYRNFTNKLWNISRYINEKVGKELPTEIDAKNLTAADFWIIDKFDKLISEISKDLESINLSNAGEKLRDFTWNDFADWYIEISKFENNPEKNFILRKILEDLLKLWHPFTPFATEALWKELGNKEQLMIQKFPTAEFYSQYKNLSGPVFIEKYLKDIIIAIRNFRSENNVENSKKIKLFLNVKSGEDKNIVKLIKQNENLLKSLRTGIAEIFYSSETAAANIALIHVHAINVSIPLDGLVDLEKENERQQKEIENLEKYIVSLSAKLGNKDFLKKAPESVVMENKNKLEEAQKKLLELKK